MKYDNYEIKHLEEENDAVALYRLQKEQQYLYVKINKRCPEKIFTIPVNLQNGRQHDVKFIKNSDLEDLKKGERLRKTEPQKRRGVRGRPFGFCKGCERFTDCSSDIYCEKRDKRNELIKNNNDDRFWHNGVPKKHFILCKYAKYMYAHKKTAGQCQKEKCSFYDNGACFLRLEPVEKIVVEEEKLSKDLNGRSNGNGQ